MMTDEELEIFTSALEELKITYNCSCARTAEQGIKMLGNEMFDMIFLDINMPGKDGMTCLAEIRKYKTVEHVPVIIYSTCLDEASRKKAVYLGASGYIRKPSSINVLTTTLKDVFERYSVLNPYPFFHVSGSVGIKKHRK